ncbi:MAG TPA: hypothetical protein VJJ76_01380 [archaeon]|nr:hypothetical protein [archaeon]
MQIGNYEILIGRKEILVLALAFFAAAGVLVFYVSYFGGPHYTSLQQASRFDKLTGAAVLATSQQFSAAICDIFVSNPERKIKYFDSVLCADLDKTTVTVEQLLAFGEEKKGAYTIIIFASETNEGVAFSFKID